MRLTLGVEYAGKHYYGWQRQKISPTIQEQLEQALSEVANGPVQTVCAGRTDTGVNALQQVVHFNTDAIRDPFSWLSGCNSKLPDDISVTWVKEVDDDFHARFSALSRTYQYLILNRRARPALFNGMVSWEARPLDIRRMQAAASCLVGRHDFNSFRAVACQATSPVREIHSLQIEQHDNWFVITICANAFLHHMVRNIAGVLMAIGEGREAVGWCSEVLAAKDRTAGGVTVSPDGLYLVDVEYPKKYAIQKPAPLFAQFNLNKINP